MRTRKYTDEQLISVIKESYSIRQVLKKLGKSLQGGGSYYQIHNDIKRLNIDTTHFTGKGYLKGKTHTYNKPINLEKILVKNSNYCRTHLKRRLLKNNILHNKCSICGLNSIWNNIPITMVLDHINGINNDNRLENLRMVCPNCNSQLETFAGRNK